MNEKTPEQKENESQTQLQELNQQQQSSANLTQAEMMEFVKLTRYTSLASGRLTESLIKMTSKLEDEGYLKCDRSSRLNRDKKLRSYTVKLQKSDAEISNMMKLIPNHPDGEKLIQSLFKGIKNINTTIENTNSSLNENDRQQTINNEIENDQIQNETNQLFSVKVSIDSSESTDTQQNNNKFDSEELGKTSKKL